ncbi:hypothetical protein EG240_01525 [Paenimyroides tangerinum]|uniref:RiboL-PSP-HEPN domain-containing protein n=1 Tax=Paenimyroides tangerinum TaxID=2488728 RepID=A0A3P3WFL6_9FLAO|nr:hypothetical protein [Paenimyroides tangerinum]RRJ93177.1 hypothetical protein EG240_01525 [Paenimyroides tangerinum]
MIKELMFKRINENLDKYIEYYELGGPQTDRKLQAFTDLYSVIYQILENLVLENYISALTTTSFLLERFCKLGIIKHGLLGVTFLSDNYIDKLDSSYEFDAKNLNETIKKLKELKLIKEGEFKILIKMKDEMRNSFSHADSIKITKEYPKKIEAFHMNFLCPDQLQKVELDSKTTFIKNEQIELEAKKQALSNFKKLYSIIVATDRRLIKRYNSL